MVLSEKPGAAAATGGAAAAIGGAAAVHCGRANEETVPNAARITVNTRYNNYSEIMTATLPSK